MEANCALVKESLGANIVGQGNAILVEFPNRKNMLIDAGPSGSAITSVLAEMGIRNIDTFVSTNSNDEHIGGAATVISEFGIERVVDSGQSSSSQAYLNYTRSIQEAEIEIELAEEGDNLSEDQEVWVDVLSVRPSASYSPNGSMVLMISHGDVDYLLMSDVGQQVELRLIDEYDLDVEILGVSSAQETSSIQSFIEAADPIHAVFSYGNSSNHYPAQSILNRYITYGVHLYSTNEQGIITTISNGDTYFFYDDPWTGFVQ